MTVMVALLRGVNVGGRATLAMADLRRVAEGCGYTDVRTYIQSGNLVLRSSEPSPARVAGHLRTAIAREMSVQPDLVVRTRAELATIVRGNPFVARGANPAHLHVAFASGTRAASLEGIERSRYLPEEAVAKRRELYLFLPTGTGRSKLAAAVARLDGPSTTVRNWRTVTTLLAMADELA